MAAQFPVYIFLIFALSAIRVNCDVHDSCREFSTELFNATVFTQNKLNVAVSPYSIWSAMFSVALAANSTTAKEVYKGLRLPEESDKTLIRKYKNLNDQVLEMDADNVSIMSKHYMFLDNDFQMNPLFDAITTFGVGMESKTLCFNDTKTAARHANEFISNSGFKSQLMLKEYFFRETRTFMYSQVTFKEHWKFSFDYFDTTTEPFHDENGNIINEVFMMRQRNRFAFSHIKEMDAFVLELPYGPDGKYCMLIVLPSPGNFIKEVIVKLAKLSLVNILDRMNDDIQNYGLEIIEVRIPRFVIETYMKSSLDDTLMKMGMLEIFNSVSADFSRLTDESIFVSTVHHYTTIHVNESSTAASSETAVLFVDTSNKGLYPSGTTSVVPVRKRPIYYPAFVANRPFIYLVVEKSTKSIMYGGVYGERTVFK
ncbi:Serine protease inhibitor 77Ba [Eumeta japonica]|uniref:Serine protease inhibitor 77Ba n=1 Tax=Eumeta variegata TaxID=151549 RepID=A0A4C1ZPI4_EUMVA|nr:Serine protease inhibitor 77Ba [Eumeta japonica]